MTIMRPEDRKYYECKPFSLFFVDKHLTFILSISIFSLHNYQFFSFSIPEEVVSVTTQCFFFSILKDITLIYFFQLRHLQGIQKSQDGSQGPAIHIHPFLRWIYILKGRGFNSPYQAAHLTLLILHFTLCKSQAKTGGLVQSSAALTSFLSPRIITS